MEAYRAEATVETGGTLRLNHLPFGEGERVDVVVSPASARVVGWPRDYFANTFGAISDKGFIRHPQGEFESREPLA